jgi:hypothetical protein
MADGAVEKVEKTIKTTIKLADKLWRDVKVYVAKKGLKLTQVVEAALVSATAHSLGTPVGGIICWYVSSEKIFKNVPLEINVVIQHCQNGNLLLLWMTMVEEH